VDVPIDSRAGRKLGVVVRDEFPGKIWRYVAFKDGVEDEGEENFVDVGRERIKVEGVGIRED